MEETDIIVLCGNQVEDLSREICGIDVAAVYKFQGKKKDNNMIVEKS